jgi:DNA replication protein DnaC
VSLIREVLGRDFTPDEKAALEEDRKRSYELEPFDDRTLLKWSEERGDWPKPSSEVLEQRRRERDARWAGEDEERCLRTIENAVPKRSYVTATSPQLIETDAIKTALAFVADPNMTFLVLAGGVGVGKTTASVRAALEAERVAVRNNRHSGGIRLSFIAAAEIGKAAGYNDESRKVWGDLERCGFLIIDDLGTEHADKSGWFASAFDGLINTRYAECRRTIITTNLDIATFKATAGERILDRIRECGQFYTVPGESLRKNPTIKVPVAGAASPDSPPPNRPPAFVSKKSRSAIDEL